MVYNIFKIMEPSSLYGIRRVSEESVWKEVFHRAFTIYGNLLKFKPNINLTQNYLVYIESETQSPWTFAVEGTHWRMAQTSLVRGLCWFLIRCKQWFIIIFLLQVAQRLALMKILILQPVSTEVDGSSLYHVHYFLKTSFPQYAQLYDN